MDETAVVDIYPHTQAGRLAGWMSCKDRATCCLVLNGPNWESACVWCCVRKVLIICTMDALKEKCEIITVCPTSTTPLPCLRFFSQHCGRSLRSHIYLLCWLVGCWISFLFYTCWFWRPEILFGAHARFYNRRHNLLTC